MVHTVRNNYSIVFIAWIEERERVCSMHRAEGIRTSQFFFFSVASVHPGFSGLHLIDLSPHILQRPASKTTDFSWPEGWTWEGGILFILKWQVWPLTPWKVFGRCFPAAVGHLPLNMFFRVLKMLCWSTGIRRHPGCIPQETTCTAWSEEDGRGLVRSDEEINSIQ